MDAGNAKFSFTGIAVCAISLLMVLVRFWAGPFAPRPTLEQTVAEKAVAIRDATVAALKGGSTEKVTNAGKMDVDTVLATTASALGGGAIILGVLGFARKEPIRVAGGAAELGAGAISFQFAAVAVGAIIIAILVAAVISQLGIG